MPVFELEAPDGGIYEVDAPNERAAVSAFKKMDAAEPVSADSATYGGRAMNLSAGVNEGLYGTLGAPVDLMRGAMNLGIRGVNAATGSEVDQIPEDSFGGSRWIGETLGTAHPALDPANTAADTTVDRIARGVGQGAGYTVAPAGAVGALGRGGQLSGRALDTASKLTGSTASVGSAAANAGVGGVAGGSAVAAMEDVPDEWKPVAGIAGGLVGGGLAAMTGTLPALAREGGRMAGDFAAPMTAAGRERMAGTRLRDAARDPNALRAALDDGVTELVPGSKPTTFQATGDMGLGELERGSATRYPGMFGERRAAQNAARVDAVAGVQKSGAPEQVAGAVRARLAQIDDATQSILDRAADAARTRTAALGQGRTPESAGDVLRGSLEEARKVAKTGEKALWDAVDPNGTLALRPSGAKAAAIRIRQEKPTSAGPLHPVETEAYSYIDGYGDVVPLRELQGLQSYLKSGMKEERFTRGETPAYRRMAQLNAAVQDDLERAAIGAANDDAAAVAAGTLSPDDTVAARVQAIGAPSTGSSIYTPSGRQVDVGYEVVEASTLVGSNTPDMRPNPAYRRDLQPRDRTRAASDAQIARLARELEPERLGPSTTASDGAPVVGPDGMIESGNARVLGIRRAYQENGDAARRYRGYLADQGYDTAGMKEPVLIRRRKTDLDDADRVRFAQEANASTSMAMSASERAASDASRVDDDLIGLFRGGDVSDPANRDFVRAFLRKVPERGEEGSFVTSDGALSLDGVQRMRNALLQSAYDDGGLVGAMTDVGDENIRAFGRALSDISGDVARLNAGIKAGRVDAVSDLSRPLAEAARIVQDARRRGLKLSDAIAQQDAFSRPSDEAREVLMIAYGNNLTERLSRERFETALRSVIADSERQTTDARLFGEALGAQDILSGARARYGSTATQAEPVPAGRARAGRGEGGSAIRGSGNAPHRSQDIARDGREASGSRILDRSELAANFDKTALGRLRAARQATRERAETFDNKTLGPIRRRPSSSSPYDMPASAVAPRVFLPGPKGFETIQTYRNAVGDDEAFTSLRDYAVDRLRKTALREDDTLDPAKVASWRRGHADALRAFPDLDARFADAASASDTMATVGRQRKAALDQAQRSVLGKFVGVDHPDDVTRAVGQIFGAQDSMKRMAQLRGAIRGNADAEQGLRKAVVDHVTSKFVGNTEAGTSGVGTVKSDGFQTFVKKNRAALRTAGFSDDEVTLMGRVADDLQRANRSVASVKNPGGSNTAQDLTQVQKDDSGKTVLAKVVASLGAPGAGFGAGFAIGGGPGAAAGAIGAGVFAEMRRQGLEKIDDIIADALLNPGRARLLLAKAGTSKQEEALMKMLARLYRQSVVPTVAVSAPKGN